MAFGKNEISAYIKEIRVYPWNLSATGGWTEIERIHMLRDVQAVSLAVYFSLCDARTQCAVVSELIGHGNTRKAAEFARELVKLDPEARKGFEQEFKKLAHYLLSKPLLSIPSSPEEYPADVKVTIIQ